MNYNKEILDILDSWEDEDTYVVADFDRTLTSSNSITSFGIFGASPKTPKAFMQRERALYHHYRPIEIDSTISYEEKSALMTKWWESLIMSLPEFGITKNDIDNLMSDSNLITFRQGAKELLENLAQRNIPIIIMSAGLGDTIRHFLEHHNVMFPNIHIVSNFLSFDENNNVTGIKGNIIHSLNKNANLLSQKEKEQIAGRSHIILLGDQITDLAMVSESQRSEAIKICFASTEADNIKYEDYFDVVASCDTSYFQLGEELPFFSLDGIKR